MFEIGQAVQRPHLTAAAPISAQAHTISIQAPSRRTGESHGLAVMRV